MKKTFILLFTVCMLMVYNPLTSIATSNNTPSSLVDPNPVIADKAKTLVLRLNEIKAMDKSDMKSSEKKALRKEVRSIKRELQTMGSGLYISLGAVIIIALLLILLL